MKQRAIRRCVVPLVSACALGVSLLSTPVHAAAPQAGPSPADWLVWDPATHTVTLTLIAGYNSARHGFNFNGYSTGSMVIQVPVGAHVRVLFRNQGSFPHSALITSYQNRTHDSAQGFPVAFAGAATPAAQRGIPKGQSQQFSFVPTRPGRYALVCGVDHHAKGGMWDTFQVTAGGDPTLAIPEQR